MNLMILSSLGGSYASTRPESEIYVGLAKAGHNVTLLTNKDREYVPHLVKQGIQVIHSIPKRKISLSTIKLIRNTIKKNNIDIVFATNSRNIPNAAFSCIGKNVKLVVYRGTTGGLYRRDPTTYISVLHPRVDGVICVSNAVEKYVRKRMWSRTVKNVVKIYKGHDLSWYTNPETDLNQFGTNKNNFNVVCVANARPHKGLIYVVRAAKELASTKAIHILLIGEDIANEPYVSEIEKSGMQERIHLTGYRDDAPEVIAACDVLVLPSIREGLPRVILESLAYKTPVITSANEGSMEIVEDGFNGYVVPIRDPGGIADRINHLYNNPDILKELTQNSQEKLKNELSSDKTIKNYEKYFIQLLQN